MGLARFPELATLRPRLGVLADAVDPLAVLEDFRLGSPILGMPFGKVIHALLANSEIVALDVNMRPWLFGRGTAQRDRYLRQVRVGVGRA